ncbi:hypothetical protein [Sphingomonas abietis]|uniref:Uncharacterized protein n=1 Tax=Sphingomonas abietis TaxID=3012344 RepID=A0ABY7NP13_9SPHN|nr:hypothetical protein [Sphingomonas abietis]WBO23275.1 hypothetical protein PBT88_03815 [Sphingomonas abietis]
MKKIIPLAALSLTALLTSHALAASPTGISFRELEYQQPRDPLLPAAQSSDIVEHTAPARLANAAAALDAAIPVGTSRADAEAILRKAGATCRPATGTSERCRYFDVSTRDPYVDAVRWNVRVDFADDQVRRLSIDRSWVRS